MSTATQRRLSLQGLFDHRGYEGTLGQLADVVHSSDLFAKLGELCRVHGSRRACNVVGNAKTVSLTILESARPGSDEAYFRAVVTLFIRADLNGFDTYLDGNREIRVYVSTCAERALHAFLVDGYGFSDSLAEDVHEIPDGLLVPYVDAAGVLVEEPAALLARNSPLVDVCIFSKSECQLWLRPSIT